MAARSIAVGGAIATVVIWGLKALAIWIAGGLDESPLESPLFALGLVATAVTLVALGLALTSGRPLWQRVVAGILSLVIGTFLFTLVEDSVSGAVPDSAGWVQEEAGLWAWCLV